jgi:hypothetical protein
MWPRWKEALVLVLPDTLVHWSIRVQTALGDALQNTETRRRWSENFRGGSRVDLPDGDGELDLVRTANSWRTLTLGFDTQGRLSGPIYAPSPRIGMQVGHYVAASENENTLFAQRRQALVGVPNQMARPVFLLENRDFSGTHCITSAFDLSGVTSIFLVETLDDPAERTSC